MLIALGVAVCIAVFVALAGALGVGRRRAPADPTALSEPGRGDDSNGVVVVAGMVLPALIIVVALGYTIYTLRETAGIAGPGGAGAFGAHADHGGAGRDAGAADGIGSEPAVAVEITGHRWWWRVRYPNEQLVSANEVHIPAGVPVRLAVTSDDVIHSFWVPQVTGKVDMIPGKTNSILVRVDQPGVYRGLCAEFCGTQHAHMHLHLFVETPAEFADWLAAQRQIAPPPADPLRQRGQQVFAARCAECHVIRGTDAAGTRGPDLTHLASRRKLGAGVHDNNRANLAGWTTDAQSMKPGNQMPSIPLPEQDLEALLAYLESLQ